MKNKINEVVTTLRDFDDPRINWEYLKFKMREFSRETAIKLLKGRKLERENLEFKVNSYEKIDPRINWEYLKFKMREFSRETAIKLLKGRKLERENLEFKVNSYEKIISPSEDDLRDLDNAKAELEKIYDHIENGIILHSEARWYEGGGGERSNTFFR